jgi:predicted dehydrogenase
MTKEEIFVYNKHTPTPPEKDFVFGVTGLAHGHINGMCAGLKAAGAKLKAVYDENETLLADFVKRNPEVTVYSSLEELLADEKIALIATAAIPSQRAGIEIKAMRAGKDVFADKAPLITFEQLNDVKSCCEETGRKLFVYYSEFMHNEAAIFAKQLIDRGVIGEVAHIDIFAPHRLNAPSRPAWFFNRADTSGILTDIGSHQFQQFLEYAGADSATVNSARVGNYFNKEYDGFDDFGDATLTAENGVTGYVRIDWMSPKGINTWGDGRVVILGSRGYIELRKNCNLGYPASTNNVLVATDDGMHIESVSGKVGFPYFAALIRDAQERTETAMSSHQAFAAIELAMTAQKIGLEGK